MTNLTFPRKELEKHFPLTKENLDKISMFGTPLEKADKDEVEIEVFPNRPDLISMQGFARAFKSFLGKSTGLKKYKLNPPKKNYTVKIEPAVKDIRPFTVCAIVKNLKFDDEKIKEIIDLQEKLHITVGRNRKKVAIGIYPLEKIKLPITYTAKHPLAIKFKPLEFHRELNGKQIIQRHPTGKKYESLLKNAKKFPIFIDDDKKILSMPPVINSHETGKITEQTKEVFIECSGPDRNTLEKTLNIIVTTLAEMNGEIYQMNILDKTRTKTPDLRTEKMKISLENTNKLLGLNLKEKDLAKLLPRMGYNYSNKTVEVPPWRTDILHEVDLIEDISIAYGYDKLSSEIPDISTTGSESKESKTKAKLSELLAGLGATEISTYHLVKPDEVKKQKDKLEVLDSKTEYKVLRPNLLIPALRILSENVDVEYPQKIFEIGRVFKKDTNKETQIKEKDNLLFAISPANFTDIKQHLDYLMRSLNINYKLEEATKNELIDGRTGKIKIDMIEGDRSASGDKIGRTHSRNVLNQKQKTIGYIGEVHPTTLKSKGLKMPLAVFEISLEEIYKRL